MNGTTSFEANKDDHDGEPAGRLRVDQGGCGARPGGSMGHGRCRSSFLGHPTRSFLSPRLTNRKPPVEAAGAVDAKNAPTAPLKTAQNAVSHSYHRPNHRQLKCYPCSRLTLLPMSPVAHPLASLQRSGAERPTHCASYGPCTAFTLSASVESSTTTTEYMPPPAATRTAMWPTPLSWSARAPIDARVGSRSTVANTSRGPG